MLNLAHIALTIQGEVEPSDIETANRVFQTQEPMPASRIDAFFAGRCIATYVPDGNDWRKEVANG